MNSTTLQPQRARWTALVEPFAWLGATTWAPGPRIARLQDGIGAGRVLHSEWGALLARFVDAEGQVEYRTLARVQRLFATYVERLATTDPDAFADSADQLAFFLNAYNALALFQAVQRYPVPSLRAVPYAFLRPYPVGQRNVSLIQLHGTFVRAFGDPRVHAALFPAARGGPVLSTEPFVGTQLHEQLDAATRRLLADQQRGARYDGATNTLFVAAPLVRWAGDWVYPHLMPRLPGVLAGRIQPRHFLNALAPFLPPALATIANTNHPTVRSLPFDWTLNDQAA